MVKPKVTELKIKDRTTIALIARPMVGSLLRACAFLVKPVRVSSSFLTKNCSSMMGFKCFVGRGTVVCEIKQAGRGNDRRHMQKRQEEGVSGGFVVSGLGYP